MVRYIPNSVILFFIFPILVSGQEQQITEKKSELVQIKNEIQHLENELAQKSAKEKQTYSALENFNKQNHLINKLIISIEKEVNIKEQQIKKNENKIEELEQEIESLKGNYARSIKAIYKYGKINELEALVDANSVRQAVLRLKYIKEFSRQREKDVERLNEAKENLIAAKNQLKKERQTKQNLIAEKKKEESTLNTKLQEREKILTSIKDDKKELRKELELKKDAAGKIKNLITKLIEEAERRREQERLTRIERERIRNKNIAVDDLTETETTVYDVDLSTTGMENFSSLKGRMLWPVENGKISRKFGENKNIKLNTVTLNYGIDIKASNDLNVRAVGEGVVSAIDFIPGYGSVIIITHKNDYRTVYSHLSQIYVKEGDKVKSGSIIAKVGASLEGNVLHFEIWNERDNQNPEVWLAKR